MKRILMVLVAAASLSLAGAASAQDKPAAEKPAADKPAAAEKPDCSTQKTAYDDSVKAAKVKPDLSSCADKKGKEKSECEKPLKEQAKADATAAKAKVKEAKLALDCCKNPKKKACAETAAAPAAAPATPPAAAPK
jgi:histone H1/5